MMSVRCSTGDSDGADFDAKVFRHNLTRSENYNRKGFGHKKETLELMNQEYTSKNNCVLSMCLIFGIISVFYNHIFNTGNKNCTPIKHPISYANEG